MPDSADAGSTAGSPVGSAPTNSARWLRAAQCQPMRWCSPPRRPPNYPIGSTRFVAPPKTSPPPLTKERLRRNYASCARSCCARPRPPTGGDEPPATPGALEGSALGEIPRPPCGGLLISRAKLAALACNTGRGRSPLSFATPPRGSGGRSLRPESGHGFPHSPFRWCQFLPEFGKRPSTRFLVGGKCVGGRTSLSAPNTPLTGVRLPSHPRSSGSHRSAHTSAPRNCP